MKIAIMFNPVSGRGRSAKAAELAAAALERAEHEPVVVASLLESTATWLDPALKDAKLLIVCGGDGAMRLAAPSAAQNQIPLYHLPLGTENLFAREFSMTAYLDRLIRSIDRWQIDRVDAGMANGHWFLLMASIGFDAEVVHELAATRGGSISHMTYVRPIVRTALRWQAPRLSVSVDGQRLVDDQAGMAVVANSRQYGWRIDPAVDAKMNDGLLDVVFMPARSVGSLAMWALRCRMRTQAKHCGHITARGREISVSCESPTRFQLDGDPPACPEAVTNPERLPAVSPASPTESRALFTLNCSVQPGRLLVLRGS